MTFKYRADHVGSFLRPQEILEARGNPQIDRQQLKEIEDRHILRVLERQQDLGFKIFSDGELRRRGFMSGFHESVAGLDMDGSITRAWKSSSGNSGGLDRVRLGGIVVEKIRQTRRLAKDEADFLRQHSPGDLKMTLPTANQFPAIAYQKGLNDRIDPTYSEF